MEYVKEHPLFTLSERERQGLGHYYQLLMNKTQDRDGSFQHDVVRLLFQALILEFQMFVDRRRGDTAEKRQHAEGERFFRPSEYASLKIHRVTKKEAFFFVI